MNPHDYSRREFLIRFATLSSASLLLGTPIACGEYGPGSVLVGPMVSGMYFLDDQSRTMLLQKNPINQNIPLHTKFTIEFTDDMNTSAPATVFLADSSYVPVIFVKTWDTPRTITVTPSSDLEPDKEYTLRMGDDAENVVGQKIYLTAGSTAVFKTVAA